jgi:uncharacterized protein YjbJ (UPF0337 family)
MVTRARDARNATRAGGIMADRDQTRRGDKNSLKGMGNDLKGKIKDAAGGLTGDTSLQAEGKWDQLKGKAQKKLGDVQRELDTDPDRDDTI